MGLSVAGVEEATVSRAQSLLISESLRAIFFMMSPICQI